MGFQITLTSEQKAQMWAYLRRKVNEVESHLRADDINGANDLMDGVVNDAGMGAHDLILDAIAGLRGQTGWRTFVPRDPDLAGD